MRAHICQAVGGVIKPSEEEQNKKTTAMFTQRDMINIKGTKQQKKNDHIALGICHAITLGPCARSYAGPCAARMCVRYGNVDNFIYEVRS